MGEIWVLSSWSSLSPSPSVSHSDLTTSIVVTPKDRFMLSAAKCPTLDNASSLVCHEIF